MKILILATLLFLITCRDKKGEVTKFEENAVIQENKKEIVFEENLKWEKC